MRRRALGGHLTGRTAVLVALETLLIVGSVVLATYIRLREWSWQEVTEGGGDLVKALLIALVCQLSLYWLDLYDLRVVADRREMFIRLVRALGVTALTLAVIYFWFPALVIGRGVFVIAAILALTSITAWRLAFEWLTHQVSPRERLLLVGTSPAAIDLARELHGRRAELGVEIAGFVDVDPARVGAPLINPGVIGTIEDIPAIVRARSVDRVVVSLADARGKLPMDKLLEMKLEGVTFDDLPSVYEDYTGKIAVGSLRPSWLIFSRGFRKSSVLQTAKRTLDVAFAVIGLALGLPLLLAVAAAVKSTSPGRVLYRQQRVGRYGRLFTVYKFRSMCQDAEAQTGAVWAAKNDARITAVGRILRRARLDELPQLWNVVKGEMSLVGPRPERPEFVSQLTAEIPFYGQRHVVRPGLTGWAQVCYTYAASVEDATEKLQYDLYYIKHLSLAFDLFIILLTLKTVVLGRGAS